MILRVKLFRASNHIDIQTTHNYNRPSHYHNFMKGCFLLQRRFAFLGHDLIQTLKEQYGLTEFCGYVYLRSSYHFLKNQTDIPYTNLLLDDEIHNQYKTERLDLEYLEQLEKKYGLPNLWYYLSVDRVLMHHQLVREYPYDKPPYTYEEMLRIVQVHAKSIIAFLEKEKPDYVFFNQAIGGVGSLLLFHIAKKMNIPLYVLCLTGIKDTSTIGNDPIYFAETSDAHDYTTTELTQARAYVDEFRSKPQTYSSIHQLNKLKLERRQHFGFLRPRNALRSIVWFFTLLKEYCFSDIRHDYSYTSPWNYLKDHTKRKIRNALRIPYDAFDPSENYAFFPLHFEPEISLSLMAPWNTNQIEVARHIARSLPVGWKLYIKEHPQMAAFRPRSYYRELKKIPNVRLLEPTLPSYTITQNAKLVTVITGTVGWEGTLLKKPVITLGDVFYNRLSFIRRCHAHEDLPYIVQEALANFSTTYNETELLGFISGIMKNSITDIDLLYLWDKEQDEQRKKQALEPLAHLLAQKLGVSARERA